MHSDHPAVVGLLPAAGRAHRMSPLPCSKEIYPIGFRTDERTGDLRPRVVSHHLFEKFRAAGITTAYVVVRSGKWDIPAYFGDGSVVGVDIAYRVISESIGPPDTIDRAYSFVHHRWIAFAFPDMVFGPDDVFRQLLQRLTSTTATVVLGLYPTADVQRMDMIEVDAAGRVHHILLKPSQSDLRYTWTCAVWKPEFTEDLHACVERERRSSGAARRDIDAGGDLPMGSVLQAALADGMVVEGVTFAGQTFVDIGIPVQLKEYLER
jgi:glucose-1-phosphate thymidylyltransferase